MDRPSLRSLWDIGVLLTAMILAIEVPLLVVLDEVELKSMTPVSLGATVVFVIDAILRSKDRDFKRTRGEQSYAVRRGFALATDVVACLPFAALLPTPWANLELIRLVKVIRVQQILRKWKSNYAINPGILRMANFAFWMAVIAHWVACGWIALDAMESISDPTTRYVRSLYWCITTLATVGYGDIVPRTNLQTIYTILVMIGGVAFYGFVIGNVASLISSVDVARSRFLEKTEQVDAFLRHHSIPPTLRERIHEYYQYLWDSKLGHGEDELLTDLVHQLKTDILLHIRKPLIQKVPVFAQAGDLFLREIIYLLRPKIFMPGDEIVRHGDMGESMFFLGSGEVEVVGKSGERFAVLKEGAYFGEVALLKETPRTATVRATDFCHTYELHRNDLKHMMQEYPEFERQILEASKSYKN